MIFSRVQGGAARVSKPAVDLERVPSRSFPAELDPHLRLAAVTSGSRDYPEGDLTRQQVALIRESIEAAYDRITEVVDMLGRYADAGGRDWETWNALLANGLSRQR